MKRFLMLFVFFGLAVAAIARAEVTAGASVLNQQPINQNADKGYVLDAKGGMWLAYYGNDNFLYVRYPNGIEVKLGAQDRERYQSGLAMDAGQDSLALLWRDKFPKKALYLLPSLTVDGSVPQSAVVGGDESEPLTRLKIAHQGDGVYMLWLGEKPNPETKQRFHLYFRFSKDDGKTFSSVERVLPGIYPMWIVDKDSIPVFSWVWQGAQNRHVMVMRRFDRTDQTFGPMVEIAETPEQISPIYRTFESAGRWFVLWLAQYGDGKDFLLEGAYSEDKGQSWKRFSFDAIKGLDLSHLSAATDGEGHIALALSGSRGLRDDNPNAKNDVYWTTSADNGTTWSEPRRIRAPEYQVTQARFPTISFGSPPGTLVMAWEDWRDIRPNIYVAYSTDNGVTWQKEVPLGSPGRVNLAMDFKLEQGMISRGDAYNLVVKRFENDTFSKADLVHYSFTLSDLKQPPAPSPALDLEKANLNEEQLRRRVQQYWDAMQREDYAVTYALTDSFFQSRVDRQTYLQKMGTIKYRNFHIDSVERQGKIAKLKVIVESGVPEFKSPTSGKTYSKPWQPYAFVDTWLFISGDWYREYNEESSGVRYTQY